jgi:hypothetical protein
MFLLHAVCVPDADAIERAVHKRLASHRLSGEWFAAPVDLVIEAIGAEISARGWTGLPVAERPAPVRSALTELDNGLARYLVRHKICASEFARRLSVGPAFMHMLITEKRGPSLQTAQRIVALTQGEVTFSDLEVMHRSATARRKSAA